MNKKTLLCNGISIEMLIIEIFNKGKKEKVEKDLSIKFFFPKKNQFRLLKDILIILHNILHIFLCAHLCFLK